MAHVQKQIYITFTVNSVERTSSDEGTTADTWKNFGQVRSADEIAKSFISRACSWVRCRPRDIAVSKIEARSLSNDRKVLDTAEG